MYSDGNRTVRSTDKIGAGGAHVEFEVFTGQGDREAGEVLGKIHFQDDTIPNVGVVGWTNECLLAIVSDRLKSFQSGRFPCDENDQTMTRVDEALSILERRTADRMARNVEGQHKA